MTSLFANKDARHLFLEIINTYGQFLKARDIVKSLNLEIPFQRLRSELSVHEYDPYSWSAREYGEMSGISPCSIEDIQKAAKKDLDEIKEELILKLISCEKHHKKLKHQFRERFPELNTQMQILLKEHKEFVENKKRKEHAKYSSIIGMSNRFISFLHYSFDIGEGLHLSYSAFASYMIDKYNIQFNQEQFKKLINDCDVHNSSVEAVANKKLTLDEISFIASIIKQFVDNVTQEDLDNVELYTHSAKEKPENKAVSEKIIKGEFARFKKLFSDYSAAIAEIQ